MGAGGRDGSFKILVVVAVGRSRSSSSSNNRGSIVVICEVTTQLQFTKVILAMPEISRPEATTIMTLCEHTRTNAHALN